MRRILLVLAGVAVLTLPAAAAARPASVSGPGYLVVRDASTDAGIAGSPVVTLVVNGFVLGRVAQQGSVELYRLSGTVAPQAAGVDVSRRPVTYIGRGGVRVPGTAFSGSGFRFRAVGGVWRVVIHGAGISLYAGGEGHVSVHGSVAYPSQDGEYSLNGGPFASLPSGIVTQTLGAN